jgi:ribonuclease E
MPTTTDLIGLAIDKNPVEFASAFDDILRQKQESALEAHKIELAKTIYGDEPEDEDEVDFGDDSNESDDDTGDDDDLELDIDLDDLDLDDLDLDLEDITDDNEDA